MPRRAVLDLRPDEFRDAIGTSFAAPQVSAAAALLLGAGPEAHSRPGVVAARAERRRRLAATGCAECPVGRDMYSGWGSLDVLSALTMLTNGTPLPPPDRYEPNDEAGTWAHALPPLPRTIDASLDYWDDNVDVYHVYLRRGQRLYARLTPRRRAGIRLAVWSPGTKRVEGLQVDVSRRVAQSPQRRGAGAPRVPGAGERDLLPRRRSSSAAVAEPGAVPALARPRA